MAVVYYHVATVKVKDSASSNEIPLTGGKIEVPVDGVVIRFKGARWWTAKNTGYYDAAGTKTASAYSMYYRYGTSAPNLTYAGATTAADLESLVVAPEESADLMPPMSGEAEWSVFFKPDASATNGVTIVVTPNISFWNN